MKLSEIYERAAEESMSYGACNAICNVEGKQWHRGDSLACPFFAALFDNGHIFWWDMNFEGDQQRRLALCFAAAIARSEGK